MLLAYIYICVFLFILSFFKNETYGKEIKLNIVAYADNADNTLYVTMVNDFNNYAKEKKLNITLNLKTFVSFLNFTNQESFGTAVEHLLNKKNNKYDLYYYDNAYTPKYGKYLLNLRKYLPKEHIEMYQPKLLEETCEYEDKLVGLPYSRTFSVLYSNDILLKRYNKTIPQTWDELIETSHYIMEKEKKNNTNLIAYNGFLDDENGICSIYEFIHSCRDSPEDPFPGINSETSKKALNLLKRIKNEISSDDIFKQGFMYNLNLLLEGKALFVKFWTLTYNILNTIPYTVSLLPGLNKGVSGSTIAGYNIGIIKDIVPEKKKAAITALMYMTSKEFQKKYFLIENVDAGISSLYEDEEICRKINCEVYKNVQINGRPTSEYYSFDDYISRITKYVNQFLYDNKPVEKVLEEISDLTEIHYISISNKDTRLVAIIFLIIVIVLGILLLIPLFYLNKYESFFTYFTKGSWITITLGLILILSSFFPTLGQLSVFKCNIYIIQLIIGYTFILVPILYKFIIDFPKNNKISKWTYENKNIFFLVFLLIDIVLILIISIDSINVDTILINEGENFNKCKYNSIFGIIVSIICYVIILIIMLLLSFVEWYRKTYCYDVRINTFLIYAITLVILLSYIFYFISINNYIYYFISKNMFNLIFVSSSILFLYIFRLYTFSSDENNNGFKFNIDRISQSHSSTNSNSGFVMRLKEYQNMTRTVNTDMLHSEINRLSKKSNKNQIKQNNYIIHYNEY